MSFRWISYPSSNNVAASNPLFRLGIVFIHGGLGVGQLQWRPPSVIHATGDDHDEEDAVEQLAMVEFDYKLNNATALSACSRCRVGREPPSLCSTPPSSPASHVGAPTAGGWPSRASREAAGTGSISQRSTPQGACGTRSMRSRQRMSASITLATSCSCLLLLLPS